MVNIVFEVLFRPGSIRISIGSGINVRVGGGQFRHLGFAPVIEIAPDSDGADSVGEVAVQNLDRHVHFEYDDVFVTVLLYGTSLKLTIGSVCDWLKKKRLPLLGFLWAEAGLS